MAKITSTAIATSGSSANALVRAPAELPCTDVTSWTVETRNFRGSVQAVAYRPDGKVLATGSHDGTVRLWDPATGELPRMLVGSRATSLSWSKDGKQLATAGYDGETQLWEADTGRLLRRVSGTTWAAWAPDGPALLIGSSNDLRLWDPATGQVIIRQAFPGHLSAA